MTAAPAPSSAPSAPPPVPSQATPSPGSDPGPIPGPARAVSEPNPEPQTGATHWVAVAVATVWRDPDRPRPVDLPALANPTALREWLAALDVAAKKDLVGRIETQVLLGQPVTVLEERDGWVRVAVPEQPEPGAPRGYPGWIPSWQLTSDPAWAALAGPTGAGGAWGPWAAPSTPPDQSSVGSGSKAAVVPATVTVAAVTTWLHHRPHPQARWMEISFGTRLPLVGELAPSGCGGAGSSPSARSSGTGPSTTDGGAGTSSSAGAASSTSTIRGWETWDGAGGPMATTEREGWIAVAVPVPEWCAGLSPPGEGAGGRVPRGARTDPGATGAGVAVAWVRRADVRIDGRQTTPGVAEGAREEHGPAPTGAGGVRPGSTATGSMLLETARRFLGVPYLWGGTSGFAVDCSGFVYLVHRFHGIAIPRDAGPQRDHGGGQPVPRDRLRPGDLVFFAHDGGKGQVHHVGMYAGDGRMIHAPNSERVVEEIPLDTPPYGERYAGARRYHAG